MTDTLSIHITPSTPTDINAIMTVYDSAIRFMRSRGNMKQWGNGYPSADIILHDISLRNHFTCRTKDGRIAAVFSFIRGADPTYSTIKGGGWLNNNPYGTIHRIASAGITNRILEACVDYCFQYERDIRIDTHEDNHPMLDALARLGFTRCGIIHLANGNPRVAFQKHISQ